MDVASLYHSTTEASGRYKRIKKFEINAELSVPCMLFAIAIYSSLVYMRFAVLAE